MKRRDEETYIQFVYGNGCAAQVGKSRGRNLVSLGDMCWGRATAIHEIAHALGENILLFVVLDLVS